MKHGLWEEIEKRFQEYPGARAEPAPEPEIQAAEQRLGCIFAPDYREFLARFGSGLVGPDPIYGLRPARFMGTPWSVVAQTERFRGEGWPGVDGWYVISGDGRGNPVGVDGAGKVWLSDHDVGDIKLMAKSFEGFIKRQLRR